MVSLHVSDKIAQQIDDLATQQQLTPDELIELMIDVYTEGPEIAELRQLVTDLAGSDHKFRALLESASIAIAIINNQGEIVMTNAQAESDFGYNRDELIGASIDLLLPERLRTKHGQHRLGFFANPRTRTMGPGLNLVAQRKDGTEFPIEVGLSAVEVGGETLVMSFIIDISKRKLAQEAAERQEQRLRILYEITTHPDLEMDEQFNLALAAGAQMLDLDIGIISQIHGDSYRVLHFNSPQEGLHQDQLFDLGSTYCSITLEADTVLAIDYFQQSEFSGHPCYEAFKLEQYIGVPLYVDGKRFGTLNFSSAQPRTTAFSDADKDFVRIMGRWVSTTIERMLASESLQASHRNLQHEYRLRDALATVELSINEPHELRRVLNRIVNLVKEILPAEGGASVVLWDKTTNSFTVSANSVSDQAPQTTANRVRRSGGATHWIVENKRFLEVADVNEDPFGPNTMMVEYGIRSYLGFPMQADDKIIGVLYALKLEPHHFSQAEIDLMAMFANRAALAVSKVNLYEQLQATISQLADTSAELTIQAEQLAIANEEVKRFAYIVSHDLRAPLVNIKGFAAELKESLATIEQTINPLLLHLDSAQQAEMTMILKEDAPEAMGFIDSSVKRMDHFINAILQLSRLGHKELYFEQIDMNGVVDETLRSLTHQIEERQVDIVRHPLPDVMADATAIEQIIGNILTNAVVYLDASRSGRIEIGGERQDRRVQYFVRDNGRGIAEDDHFKIFEPFRRAGRQNVPGEGMGMAYVQALIRRHSGRIWFESALDVGTTFFFTISNQLGAEDKHA